MTFVAGQLGLRFEQLNIFVGVAKMDVAKSDPDLEALMRVVRAHAGKGVAELQPA